MFCILAISLKITGGGAAFTKIVGLRGCACQTSKSDFLYTNFLPNFPPAVSFSKEMHQILIKFSAFYINLPKIHPIYVIWAPSSSGVARAFPGGQLAHPEGQNEEENEKSLRISQKIWSKLEEKMRKVELLPTRNCEAGHGPALVSDENPRSLLQISQKSAPTGRHRYVYHVNVRTRGNSWVIGNSAMLGFDCHNLGLINRSNLTSIAPMRYFRIG